MITTQTITTIDRENLETRFLHACRQYGLAMVREGFGTVVTPLMVERLRGRAEGIGEVLYGYPDEARVEVERIAEEVRREYAAA